MAETEQVTTPEPEVHSVDVQDEGSLVDDVIFGGDKGSVAEAFDENGRIVANGQGIGRYRDGCHLPEGLPRPEGVSKGKSPQRFSDG